MKRIFTTCVLLIGLSIFAQEAGRSGELLKNEASQTEMQTQRKEVLGKKAEVLDNSGYRNPNVRNQDNNRSTNNNTRNVSYKWNQNLGNAEIFLRIPENGNFSVEIGDQYIANNAGKFRFFDLNAGRIPISIYENGYLVYRTRINIQNNRRLVLDFFTGKGLYLLDAYPVQNQTYGFNEWDDVWNNPYGNNFNNNPNQNFYGNVMNERDFTNFLYSLRKSASFDNSRIDLIQLQMKNTYFTSLQIKSLLNEMSFDKNKLTVAKMAYSKCVDRQNFFAVFEAFSFDSYRRQLSDYISKVG